MTIDEAIKVLKDLANGRFTGDRYAARNAELLGIEALKRVKIERTTTFRHSELLLPGETEE